jgi:hypothetical protein
LWLDNFAEKRSHTIAVQAEVFEQTNTNIVQGGGSQDPRLFKKVGDLGI